MQLLRHSGWLLCCSVWLLGCYYEVARLFLDFFLECCYVAAGTYYHIATTFLPFQLKILFGSSGFVYVVLFH